MAYKNPDELFRDPDFQQSSPENQRWALKTVDPSKWGKVSDTEVDAFLGRMKTNWDRENSKMAVAAQQLKGVPPPPPPGSEKTKWEKVVEPATQAVGRGMEMATAPLVPLARLMQGEGMQSFSPEYKSASHPTTAAMMGAGVVPQSPWQAGAMAAPFLVPGAGAVPALARVGAAGVGGGALQGLLGSEGLLEGGANVAGEALRGGLKGAGTQAAGEVLGKLLGAGRRGTAAVGLTESTGAKDVRRTMGAVREASPELYPGKGAAAAGEFFTGSKKASEAAGGAYSAAMSNLEKKLLDKTGQPYINSPELTEAYAVLAKKYGRNPIYKDQLQGLKPGPGGGFLPEQAKEILAITRDMLSLKADATGKFNQDALNNLVGKIEASLPVEAQGLLTKGREGFARASGISELLQGVIKTGKHGYEVDTQLLQSKLATNPDLAARIGPGELEKLIAAVTRGAGKGFSDVKSSGNISYPYHLAPTGISFAALRNFLTRGSKVGKHPQALEQGTKAGLGVASTAASSVLNRATRRDEE